MSKMLNTQGRNDLIRQIEKEHKDGERVRDVRNADTALARRMLRLTRPAALAFVRSQIAPRFAPLAAPGVGRI